MIGLAIDKTTNDLALDGAGNMMTVTDAHAVGQHVRQRLKTHQGEWFLDTQAGVPWLDQVLGRQYDPALAEAVIKAEISETAGVTGISGFSVQFDGRTREISAFDMTVETIFDEEVSV